MVSRRPHYLRLMLPSFWLGLTKQQKKRQTVKILVLSMTLAVVLLFLNGLIGAYLEAKGVPLVNSKEYPLTKEKIPPVILFPLVNIFAFLEEWLFRAVLLEELSISFRSRFVGLVTSSLLFGVFHLSNPGTYPILVLPLSFAGLLLGVAYLTWGFQCSVLTHCLYNSVLVILG